MTNIFGSILDHLSAVAANWVVAERDRLRPESRALTDAEKRAMAPWFAAATLHQARVVLVERCPSPDFLSPELIARLQALNVDPTLFRMEAMAGITFDELIVIATRGQATPRLRPGLLFHELVHVAQYRALGVERFMEIYVRGFGEAGYWGTPPEAQAHALTARFERGEVFSADEDAGRLPRAGPGVLDQGSGRPKTGRAPRRTGFRTPRRNTEMIVKSKDDCQLTPVDSLDYRGQSRPVAGVKICWLSKQGRDAGGQPAYGLRLFEVGPGGEIPIHNHAYVQTMYILSGEFECWQFDPDTDELVAKVVCRAGDTVFIPGWEPHGMRNLSPSDAATFVCCICSLNEDRGV